MAKKKRTPIGPGSTWRVLATGGKKSAGFDAGMGADSWVTGDPDKTEFDEVVVGNWLHFERMDTRDWWGRVGQLDLWVHIGAWDRKTKTHRVTVYVRDFDGSVENTSGRDLPRKKSK